MRGLRHDGLSVERVALSTRLRRRANNINAQLIRRNVKIMACRAALPYRLLFPKPQWYTYRVQGKREAFAH